MIWAAYAAMLMACSAALILRLRFISGGSVINTFVLIGEGMFVILTSPILAY
jgi:hypothetical protein